MTKVQTIKANMYERNSGKAWQGLNDSEKYRTINPSISFLCFLLHDR
jgi:hypothetical protein